jgi:hypothetical protein
MFDHIARRIGGLENRINNSIGFVPEQQIESDINITGDWQEDGNSYKIASNGAGNWNFKYLGIFIPGKYKLRMTYMSELGNKTHAGLLYLGVTPKDTATLSITNLINGDALNWTDLTTTRVILDSNEFDISERGVIIGRITHTAGDAGDVLWIDRYLRILKID